MRKSRKRKLKRVLFLSTRNKKACRAARRFKRRLSWPPPRLAPVKITRKQKRRPSDYDRTPTQVKFPAKFDLIDNTKEIVSFFSSLRDAILVKARRKVAIDHQTIEQVSPATGIVLIAELFRADAYAPKCTKVGNLPKNSEVAELLEKIGYWKYFGVQFTGKSSSNRQFMIHKTGNRTTPTVVVDMIVHFRDAVRFTTQEEKRLYVALIECLDNVMNHAYPYERRYEPPCLRHQWWVLAYRDAETHEACVCFYDQGVGIPETMRRRAKEQLVLFNETDGELVIKAVIEGYYSRHMGTTRGTGLPSLKQFTDEANSGELIIVSHGVMCTFPHGEKPTYKVLDEPFCGTLIQWRICR
jgi:anti-sigma regulatory factor (Ser/Thr protein kinase)